LTVCSSEFLRLGMFSNDDLLIMNIICPALSGH
jgi:hypothetical protein